MSAPIVQVDSEFPSPRVVERARAALEEGLLVACPTDTYYAVVCDLTSRRAIERLYALKGRDKKKPLAILCPDLSDIARYALVSTTGYRILKHHLPGPFTFVLEATRLVPDMMATRQRQVGIRIPGMELPRALARALGRPLVTTSASGADGEVLVDARDIKARLGHALALVLDGGVTHNEPSTVVAIEGNAVEVLRQGKGALED